MVVFGLSLSFVLIETGLRLGGTVILSIQEQRNRQALRQKGVYRIMCIGESTTQKQYPLFLESPLNQAAIGIKFRVINKGLGATTTSGILARLPADLEEYHPDLVVAMMGVNDANMDMSCRIPATSKAGDFFRSLKILKLARLLRLRVLNAIQETGIHACNLNTPYSKDEKTCINLGLFYQEHGKYSQAEVFFKRAIALNPKNYNAYFGLGYLYSEQSQSWVKTALKTGVNRISGNRDPYISLVSFYRQDGNVPETEQILRRAMESGPEDSKVYVALYWLYRIRGDFPQSEEMFKKAIKIDPGTAYNQLGWFYREDGNFPEAEQAFKKAAELDPQDDAAYIQLGRIYQEKGRGSEAEQAFKKAITLNPRDYNAYFGLGYLYSDQNQYLQQEQALEKASATDTKKNKARAYRALYKSEFAPNKKANYPKQEYYSPVTINNYHKLKEILERKKVKLLCVQYPLRKVEPLKKLFEGNSQGIIFADNEKIFKDAVSQEGYKTYFVDLFAGDFGHCTRKGDQLLAGNIAKVILKEVFAK